MTVDIFIDSADIDEIKEAFSFRAVSGITTNPALIMKAAQKHGVSDFGDEDRTASWTMPGLTMPTIGAARL